MPQSVYLSFKLLTCCHNIGQTSVGQGVQISKSCISVVGNNAVLQFLCGNTAICTVLGYYIVLIILQIFSISDDRITGYTVDNATFVVLTVCCIGIAVAFQCIDAVSYTHLDVYKRQYPDGIPVYFCE